MVVIKITHFGAPPSLTSYFIFLTSSLRPRLIEAGSRCIMNIIGRVFRADFLNGTSKDTLHWIRQMKVIIG